MREFVWVTADLAAPPRAGGEIRSARLLTALAALASVDLVLLSRRADADAVQELTGVRSVLHRRPADAPYRRRFRALRTGLPLRTAGLLDPIARRFVSERAAQGAVVIANRIFAAPYLMSAESSVLQLNDDDAAVVRQLVPRGGLRERLEHAWDVRTTRALQDRALADASHVVCVSDLDAIRLGRPDALVVPNGTDLPRATTPVPVGGDLVFVGSLDYAPNEDAVRWWLAEIDPLLPRHLPPLRVVGRAADRVLADLSGHPRLIVHADVPDVSPYLQRASVVVQPIRLGGGSRLKLLEAFGHERPVVTTPHGAEGFAVVDGEHLLLASDPERFGAMVTSTYENSTQAARLAAAAREFALPYDWRDIAGRFAAQLIDLTAR